MGNLIYTCFSNSKANSDARITDSSIWSPLPDQHISILTFRELRAPPMSSPISTKTGTPLNGENSRSTDEVLEEVSRRLMTVTPKH
ncbi:AC4 [Insect-associated begomovirus 4]|nr:AC4 [Insect-associated begomovirus 4]